MTTATPPTLTRDQEIRQIWKDYHTFYRILGALTILAIGILIGAKLFNADSGYTVNLFTEALGIFITVFILDYLNRRRDEQNATRQLQQQLIMDAGSTSNEKAKDAIHQLTRRKELWGEKGLLQGENLSDANLEGVILKNANLRTTKLRRTTLKQANLWFTDLRGADLTLANLEEAQLTNQGKTEAIMTTKEFGSTPFFSFQFDESTVLPDGTHWSPDVDMRRFTDPDHPDFWQPAS